MEGGPGQGPSRRRVRAGRAGPPDHDAARAEGRRGAQGRQLRLYDGGGELLTALLGSKISFGATGTGEIAEQAKSGDVRVLAVTSAQKVPGLDAPTLKEAGVDLEFTNWRGIVAAPGISAEDKTKLVGLVDKMHASQPWKDAVAKNGWTDAYVSGDQFGAFLKSEDQRVRGVLGELGLA